MVELIPGAGVLRRVHVEDQRELVDAIAVWTENLRDALSTAAGIEHAVLSTADHAPAALAGHVDVLVSSVRYRGMEEALREFADGLSNPTSDFVVTALVLSLNHHTRNLPALLTHLSECARSESDLYTRMWVSRARSRTAVRIITWSVVAFSAGLGALNPVYLSPFASRGGVVALVFVGLCFALGLVWLRAMTTLDPPPRFLRHGERLL